MTGSSQINIQAQPTPLPKKQMLALALVLLTESLCSTMLLPYVGLLVAHLRNRPVEESGYVSGLLISVFMFGQVVSGKMWGYLSDVYGRRLPLIIGLLNSGFMMLGFGFSPNVFLCIVFRFFHGLFNGNVLVAKTVLADILDSTNASKGFTLVSLTFGFGSLIGPAIGGLLYDPATNGALSWMNISKDSLFSKFPGLLPSLILFAYTYFAMFVCIVFLDESNKNAQPLPQWVTAILRPFCAKSEFAVVNTESAVVVSGSPIEDFSDSTSEELSIIHLNKISSPTDPANVKTLSPTSPNEVLGDAHNEGKSFGYTEAFRMSSTRHVLILYMLLSASDIAVTEVFPLWAVTSTSVGGLGYNSDVVGLFLLWNSVPCVLGNLVFHKVCDAFSNKMLLWRISTCATAACVLTLPFISYLPQSLYIVFVGMVSFVHRWFNPWSFGLTILLTARVAPDGHVGCMYGISQSCSSGVRCMIPLIATPLYAWSIARERSIPFNHILVFMLSAMGFIACSVYSCGIVIRDKQPETQVTVEINESALEEREAVPIVSKNAECDAQVDK